MSVSTEDRQKENYDFREKITQLSKIYFSIFRDNPQFDVLRTNIRNDLEKLVNEHSPNPREVA